MASLSSLFLLAFRPRLKVVSRSSIGLLGYGWSDRSYSYRLEEQMNTQ
jgi:hypothetical protein